MIVCENCGTKIPDLEDRQAPGEDGQGGNVPYVWWTPEIHYTCSNECFRVKYLGCEPSKKLEKKKAICPNCRALKGRCPEHSTSEKSPQ